MKMILERRHIHFRLNLLLYIPASPHLLEIPASYYMLNLVPLDHSFCADAEQQIRTSRNFLKERCN